jgi:electron transfer flavoprotein beta subunit
MMHFICCVKQVPDTAEIKIDPQTNTLVRSSVDAIANPFDMVALEAALRLKEHYGGYITVISMGPPQAEQVLRESLSLGADDGVLLSDRLFAGADTLATSYTLFKAIERLNSERPVDLIFCGKQAIDGDTGQTGPGLATRLGYTLFTYVSEIVGIDAEKRQIKIKRKLEGGMEVIRGPLPALLTVELELAKVRRASLPLLIHSLRAQVRTWDHQAIHADPPMLGLKGSATWVRRIFSPPVREGGPKYVVGEDPRIAVKQFLKTLFDDRVEKSEHKNADQ